MGTTTSQREGTVTSTAGGHIIRFERWLQHPATRVWEAISRPENLARWLAEVSGPIHEQGSFTLHFAISDCGANCRVTKFRPPDLLEYTWDSHDTPQSMVRWEIFPEGRSACRLVLTHTVVQLDLKTASSWHVLLDHLSLTLDGEQTSFTWSEAGWQEVHDDYVRKYPS